MAVVTATLAALGRIGTVPAAKAIEERIAGAPAGIQPRFWAGLVQCAETLREHGRQKEAAEVFHWILSANAPAWVHTAAVRGDILTGGDDSLILLARYLPTDTAAVLRLVQSEMPGSAVSGVLINELPKLSLQRQGLVIDALRQRGDAQAIPASILAALDAANRPVPDEVSPAAAKPANGHDLVPLLIKLPAMAFIGTPSDAPVDTTVEKPSGKPRPPLMVPPGISNLALHKSVTTSDTKQPAAQLAKITDGNKEADETGVVLLSRGPQWVQIDLGQPSEIFAIVVWHGHDEPKVYHGVVAQVADDAAFTTGVRTLFNNDHKNLDGLGVGTDREYFETYEGKLVEGRGARAQFVRLYSDGSTISRLNEYTEIEVHGRPVK
jgi:hypothetical protein